MYVSTYTRTRAGGAECSGHSSHGRTKDFGNLKEKELLLMLKRKADIPACQLFFKFSI